MAFKFDQNAIPTESDLWVWDDTLKIFKLAGVGEVALTNLDGGTPTSTYGGVTGVDGGSP